MNRTNRTCTLGLPGSVFLWLALAGMVQGCAWRTYYESPPATPQVLEPVNAAVLGNDVPVRFVWRETADTEHYEFHVFDRTTSDIQRYFKAPLYPSSVCAAGLCSLTLTFDMPVVEGHAWRVRSANSAGKSAWSRTLFKIEP